MDLKPGDRVRTPQGHAGRVVNVDGKYVVVAEDGGYSWRGRADDCVKMSREETTMANVGDRYYNKGDHANDPEEMVVVGDAGGGYVKLRGTKTGRTTTVPKELLGTDRLRKMSAMDLTEVCVEPDGAVEVCVDEDGDEASEILTYERAVGCPYCSKQVALFGRALGDHRALGGVCPGAGRAVARIEMGRAVLMAGIPEGTTREEALAVRARLEAEVSAAGAALKAFPRNAAGLASDAVKNSPEYRAAKSRYDKAFAQLRAFNSDFVKRFR